MRGSSIVHSNRSLSAGEVALRTCNGRGNILSRGDARVPPRSLPRPHMHTPGRPHRPYNQRIISNATTTRPTCVAQPLTSARERAGSGQTGQPQKRLLFQGMFTALLAGGARGVQTIRVLPRNFSTPLYVFFSPGNLGILPQIVEK